jgi:hypothetical protein
MICLNDFEDDFNDDFNDDFKGFDPGVGFSLSLGCP